MKTLTTIKVICIPAFFAISQVVAQSIDTATGEAQAVAPESVTVTEVVLDDASNTLNRLISTALEQHPRINSQRRVLDAALADSQAARGGYWPQVNLELGAGAEYLDPADRGLYETARAELSVTQMLYDGSRTRSNVASSRQIAALRYFELENTISDMALSIINAHENVVRHRRLLELSKESYRLTYETYQQVSQRVMSGASARVNLEQMEGRLALAESNLMVEASNLRDYLIRYQNLVGQVAPETFTLTDFNEELWPDSLSAMLDLAYERSPFLMAATSNVGVRRSEFDLAQSASRPNVFLRGRQGWHYNSGGFDSRLDDIGSRSSIELVLSMDLFTGGANSSRVNSAVATLSEAEASQLDVCLDLRQRVERSYFERNRLTNQMAFFRSHEAAADEVRGAYRAQFNVGQRSLIEVLDIETEYLDAAQARINAEHDLNLSIASGLHHSGLLLDALGLNDTLIPSLSSLNLEMPLRGDLQYCRSQPESAGLTLENLLASMDIPVGETSMASYFSRSVPVSTLEADSIFIVGSSELTASGVVEIDRFAQMFQEAEAILIEVHSDGQDSAGLSQLLSSSRAENIKQRLLMQGIPQERLFAVGRGSSQPLVGSSDSEANRRVELYVKESGVVSE